MSVFFIVICIVCSTYVYADTREIKYDVNSIIADTAEYLVRSEAAPGYGTVGGEWLVIGLARGNCAVQSEYYNKYYSSLEEYVLLNKGILNDKKYTEYSRTVLALNAIGKNPHNIGGYDLINPIYEYENVIKQGINGPIFALIALDSNNHGKKTEDETNIRQMYLDYILDRQNSDGGFSLSPKDVSDIDITAMALQALSSYKDNERCITAIDSALKFLSENQLESGGFMSYNEENSESCCQVIVALTALNIGIEDLRFIKNGNSVLDALMQFYSEKSGFKHTLTGTGANLMSTEQALYALVSVLRYAEGKKPLYDMTDVSFDNEAEQDTALTPMPIIAESVKFDDIVGNEYEAEIYALAKRAIINGKSERSFEPYASMTRAEFAAITVRALNLPVSADNVFDDVKTDMWYHGYVSAAYSAGIIKGISEDAFNPDGTITREQAAVMIERCGTLCKLISVKNNNEINNILAQFDDYKSVSDWAAGSLAFCYKNNILPQNVLNIDPQKMVMRCEVAHMLYGLLSLSNLILE